MNVRKILLLGAALLTCGAPVAQAGVLATPPVPNNIPTPGTLYCDIVNLNSSDKDVTTEIVDINGVVVAGPFSSTVPPFTGVAYSDFGSGGAWCRWTVEGSAKKYRGLAAFDNGSTYAITVPGY
jgi:hypothetical protein